MSAHVLLKILNKFGKVIKCESCQYLVAFRNKCIKFNNTGAQMLDSNYHMTLKLLKIAFLA